NQTNTVTNNTATIFPITNIPDGYHSWYVQCNDSANNIGTSVTRNFTVDTHPPSVAPNSPANLSIFNASSVSFNFTAVDNLSATMNCSLYMDGAYNQSNASTVNSTAGVFPIISIPDGNHYWSVQCIDNAYNVGTSATRNFTVDTAAPNLTIASPLNTSYNASNVTLSIVASDSHLSSIWYNNGSTNSTYTNPINLTFADGSHTIYAWANDTAGNLNSTNVSFTVDTAPPSISLSSPAPGVLLNAAAVTFNFTATDNLATTMSCALFRDGTQIGYNSSAIINMPTTMVVSTADGFHTWYVSCNDSANNTNMIVTRNFTVDTTAPAVTLHSPANSYISNSSNVTFNFTAVDNLSATMNCSLFLDNVFNQSNTSTVNSSITLFPVMIADGFHSWYIQCVDNAGNINASATRNLTVDTAAPNLTIASPLNTSYNA